MKRKFYVDYEKDDGSAMRKHPVYANKSDKAEAVGWLTINEATGAFFIVANKGELLIEVNNKNI